MVMVPQPAFSIGDTVVVKEGYGDEFDRRVAWKVTGVCIADDINGHFKISYKVESADPKVFASACFAEEALIEAYIENNNEMEIKMEQKFNNGDRVRLIDNPDRIRTVANAKPDKFGAIVIFGEDGAYLIYYQDRYELAPADPIDEIIEAAYAYEEEYGWHMGVSPYGEAIINAVRNHRKESEAA